MYVYNCINTDEDLFVYMFEKDIQIKMNFTEETALNNQI